MHKIDFFGMTDIGLVRSNNEDIFMIDADVGFCLVSDGMGGAAAGEMASQIFAQTAAEIFKASKRSSEQEVVDCVQNVFLRANERILEHVDRFPEHKGMGCTAELLAVSENGFIIGHMGDSRTYRLRQGNFKQLTKDHSLVQDQIDQGLITMEQARSHTMRNVILRAVGVRPSPALDTLRGPIFSRDLFLLCSDGLTDLVKDEEIATIIKSNSPLSSKAKQLIDLAKLLGGKDNITVVLAEVA
ncbi:MAG: Stp1/IreP family PP2C-type Ser/Thr phosphatase [Desulfobacteraceae bacterium]|nr:MAG: Stp1/IreP family PP2C-type Ser/Thr phosphatase [Desulfobacteraceae bacterium]